MSAEPYGLFAQEFSAYKGDCELMLGSVFALRWFAPYSWKSRLDLELKEEGWLYPLAWPAWGSFSSGENHASCMVLKHEAPADDCSCGFYAYADGCEDGEWKYSQFVLGVVECYGKCLLGTKGLRAEKLRIRALVTDNEVLRASYPDVRFFATREEMLSHFDIVKPHST